VKDISNLTEQGVVLSVEQDCEFVLSFMQLGSWCMFGREPIGERLYVWRSNSGSTSKFDAKSGVKWSQIRRKMLCENGPLIRHEMVSNPTQNDPKFGVKGFAKTVCKTVCKAGRKNFFNWTQDFAL